MPIEIKVFKKQGSVEPGTYEARLLKSSERSIIFASVLPAQAQIISGKHAGEVVPYENYIETGELQASAVVMLANTKMTEKLAEAGRTVAEHIRTIGSLRQENTTLADSGIRLGNRNNELEQRNKELRQALDRANEYSSILRDSLEASIHANRGEVPKEVVEALWTQITILVNRWWTNPDSEAGSVGALVNQLCRVIQQREENKQPF